MVRIFDLLLRLYPRDFRVRFGGEMRAVFLAAAQSRRPAWRFASGEYAGLLRGAAREQFQEWKLPASALACGALFASALQLMLYWCLVPGKGRELPRLFQQLASRLFVCCLLVGIACGQQLKQDQATLDLVRGIYSEAFGALRDAKTLEDLRTVSNKLDSPEWISVDRFGRTILTRKEADRDLESLLALPPERRAAGMDVIWAERDAEGLIVVAWMMPNEAERPDADGSFGPQGETHKLTRGTLIRDIFVSTKEGWRRVRHDKLLPNDMVLAVDGKPRVLPPMDAQRQVRPAKR